MARFCKFVFIALFLGYFLAAQAEAQQQKMYTWTDENGVVHFSDMEPAGQRAQEQLIPKNEPPDTSDPYATAAATEPSFADQKRQEISQKNRESKENQARKSAQCSAWQAEVAQLEPNRRVFYTNDQGETERMDDVERTNRVAELKNQIAQNCR
jgi:hypothetical protein